MNNIELKIRSKVEGMERLEKARDEISVVLNSCYWTAEEQVSNLRRVSQNFEKRVMELEEYYGD